MNFFKDILKGAVIGIANIIPGVSGGTMMVSMGIYDKIIYCITHLLTQLKESLKILFPYIVGMVVGIVGLAFSIKSLYANFPFQTSMAFIGLILGGVPMIYDKVKKTSFNVGHIGIFLLFLVAIVSMQYFGGDGTDVTLTLGIVPAVKLFFIGVIASATMVIPGVSGSMMLMILGYYNPVLNCITDFLSALAKRDTHTLLITSGSLIPFGLGVVIGIFAIAKLIEILLHKFESYTYCAILGLVVSSPIVILMGTALAGISVFTVVTGVITFVIGTFIALKLGK